MLRPRLGGLDGRRIAADGGEGRDRGRPRSRSRPRLVAHAIGDALVAAIAASVVGAVVYLAVLQALGADEIRAAIAAVRRNR